MRNMFKLMSESLAAGEDLVLVTVIASSGSTPRGSGARMLVGKKGRLAGTIGGGAVEYRSEQIAAEILERKRSGEHNFTLTKDDVENLGMICGGAVEVFFHYIPAGDQATISLVNEVEKRFNQDQDIWLISDIAGDGRLAIWSKASGSFGFDIPEIVLKSLSRQPARIKAASIDMYAEQIASSGKVYIFGCGHVGQALVPALASVGFRCIAADDRPEFADKSLFPDAEDVLLVDLENIAEKIEIGPEDYVCIMTRGHSHDTIVQAQVLRTPACYIGVIGSKYKIAGVQAELRKQGFSKTDFARITTPIGLAIKAETPAEIAISICAQMIELRATRSKA
ncbi:MAG TPA: XdhC family protein [Clostridiaceae bacterium]|jgi:xanthine dehydrogenase accessory factor|nr:XdhC family protein [Clostridiaceae bacterium]